MQNMCEICRPRKFSLFVATSMGAMEPRAAAPPRKRAAPGSRGATGRGHRRVALGRHGQGPRNQPNSEQKQYWLMKQSVRGSAQSLHCGVWAVSVGRSLGGATCDEHGFTAPSEAKASFVGSGGTLGDFIVSLNGRYVKTAVMAPSAGWLALATLPEQLERR